MSNVNELKDLKDLRQEILVLDSAVRDLMEKTSEVWVKINLNSVRKKLLIVLSSIDSEIRWSIADSSDPSPDQPGQPAS